MTTHPIASNDNVETAVKVFSAIYFCSDAFEDESLHYQLRRAMRSALLAIASHTAQKSPSDEVKDLHIKLAGETLRADQGWERYEAANMDRNALRASLAASPQLPVAQMSGDLSRVGRNMEGIEQPYAGAITLLETIAEAGCIAFYADGSPTPNRNLCLKFADDLRKVAATVPQVAQSVPREHVEILHWIFENANWDIHHVRADGKLTSADEVYDLRVNGNALGMTSQWILSFNTDYGLKEDEGDPETALMHAVNEYKHLYPESSTPQPVAASPSVVPSDLLQLIFESFNEVSRYAPMTEPMFKCMLESTGDGNKYPEPLHQLAEAALALTTASNAGEAAQGENNE